MKVVLITILIFSYMPLGQAAGIDALIAALKDDKETSVREGAAVALGGIKDANAVDPLIEAKGRHGRDAGHPAPPVQIHTCGTTA